jgi:hypothetical protein
MTLLLATPCNRPADLRGLMQSLCARAHGRDWQVIVGVDPWDEDTAREAAALGCLTIPLEGSVYRLRGHDSGDFFNVTQATNSIVKGRWWDKLWLINDDMRVLTWGWDRALETLPNGLLGVVQSIPASPCPCDFPVLSRAHRDAHRVPWPNCFAGWGADSWLCLAYGMFDMTWETGVSVTHDQRDHARMAAFMKAAMAVCEAPPEIAGYMRPIAEAAGLQFDSGDDVNDDDVCAIEVDEEENIIDHTASCKP